MLIGNLGKDPELRFTPSGRAVARFPIATSEQWTDQSGQKQDRTEWHNVQIFNENLGKVAEQYCRKGSKIYIEGQLQTRKWTDKDGVEKYSTEIVLQGFNSVLTMIGGRPGGGSDSASSFGGGDEFGQSSPMERPRAAAKPQSFARDLDDEVPF